MKKTLLTNTLIFFIALGVFIAGGVFLWVSTLRIPELGAFEERVVKQSTKIYDRTGETLLFDVHENIQRTVVPFTEISRHAKNASVAIEDAEFYDHNGIKPTSIVRATLANLGSGGFSQGGSTITQQVVKNSLLTQEKKISRKLKEWALSIKLENVATKEEILAAYLNETPYGGSIYGIQEASKSYFGKDASDLSLSESAYLAALPQAPTFYSPYGNNKEALEGRKKLVLAKMLENGFITQEELSEAETETVVFLPREEKGIKAPHFVMYVREYLESRYGERAVEERGLKVTTTLDYELQQAAEEIVKRRALENEESHNASNASLVAVDPKTGQILVMVGSRDYFDKEIEGNFNVAIAHRQPGSAFKPIVYATAFKKGYTPETVVFDLPTEFSTTCSVNSVPLTSGATCYHPVNYTGVFNGPISFRNALAQSINVPAVKALYLAGVTDSIDTARDLGVQGLTDKSQYGLTLVLGGGEVSPLDMAGAYGVFANDGIKNKNTGILKIQDSDGTILESFESRPTRVLDENIARQISDILSDNTARTPVFGARSNLYIDGVGVAAKTGTTNNYRDAWAIGYTPTISVASWAGNNDNSTMNPKAAVTVVGPIWREFMQKAIERIPKESFRSPLRGSTVDLKPIMRGIWQGGEVHIIDTISGKLATELTPKETQKEVVVPNVHSILYWVDRDNPLGPSPRNPSTDPQFSRWESPVISWSLRNSSENSVEKIPTEEDDIHTKESLPDVEIKGIKESTIYKKGQPVTIKASNDGEHPLSRIDIYINELYVGNTEKKPFSFTFVPEDVENISDENNLRVVAYDKIFNKQELEFRLLVDI